MTYTEKLIELLDTFGATQGEALQKVATTCADTIERKGLVHLFGSGHSVIPAMEAFPRYGSFVGLNPLYDPRLMWHNVLGPGGVRELLWLERTEGYVEKFLEHEPLSKGDTIIIYSHSGLNAAGIEAAIYAKKRGLTTVAVTSMKNAGRDVSHSGGKALYELCDLIIDTGSPVEDAIMDIGWGRPLGGSSTIIAGVVSHEIVTRAGQEMKARGFTLPTFVSPTVPGASVSSNDEVFEAHAAYLHEARGRALKQAN
jgi:uncharacterized phosphosugar-binding protein